MMLRRSAILMLAGACGAPSTSELHAELEVRLGNSSLELEVVGSFFMGDDDNYLDREYVELDEGDQVTALLRDRTVTLETESWTAPYYWHQLDLETPLVADEPVTFVVSREGEADVTTTLLMAPPIMLESFPLFISRSENVTFSWSPPSDDPMTWEVAGCAPPDSGDIEPGSTSATIRARSDDPGFGDTCTAELRLARWREAPVSSAFAGGRVRFYHVLVTPFTSTP